MAETTNLAAQRGTYESGDRSAAEIRRKIATERETITDTVDKLSGRLQRSLDWREYVAEYPAVALGLAAGTGFLISAIFKRKASPTERIMEAIADLTDDLTERISGVAGDVLTRSVIPQRTVTAAATTLAAKAAIDFARRKIGEALADQRNNRRGISTRESQALSRL